MPIDTAHAPTDRRAELAGAAYEIIAERGLSGLSLRALARRVGATTGIVTHHFLDRAEVVDAALAHARQAMRVRTSALPTDCSALDLLAATLPTDAHMVTSWRVWLSIRAAALHDPELEPFHEDMYAEWRVALEFKLRADLGDRTSEAVDHLMAVVDGIALRATHDPDAWPPERQRQHLVMAFDSVLAAPAAHDG